MIAKDIDKVEHARVNALAKKIDSEGLSLPNLFTSEKVVDALNGEVNYMRSYSPDALMAMLPFANNIFVGICPYCVKKDGFSNFKKFVQKGAVIPVLSSGYRFYPDEVVEFVSAHDHMSVWAFGLYKQAALFADSGRGVCAHCVEENTERALTCVKGRPDYSKYEGHVNQIRANLWPYVRPDFELFEATFEACKAANLNELKQLQKVSYGIEAVRTAQAFDAPLLLRSDDFHLLPNGILRKDDEASRIQAEMKQYALDGLGLRIPTDIDVEEYIELVSDYRPSISKVISGVTTADNCLASGFVSMTDVQKEVIRINSEIERIKGLRRSVVLNACVGFYKDHPQLVTATLVMSALGLTGHLLGCAVAGGAQVARGVARKLGGKQESEESARLKAVAKRDLLPLVDRLIAAYVGSDARAVSVLSLRNTIEDRAVRSSKKKAAILVDAKTIASKPKRIVSKPRSLIPKGS